MLGNALTCESSFAPASGYTECASRNIRRGQAHRRHTVGQLSWRGELQKGDIIVKVLTVVVGVCDGLWKFELQKISDSVLRFACLLNKRSNVGIQWEDT